MKRHRILKGLGLLTLGALFVAIAGLVVMSLWNWLTPVLFGLPAIGFAQALGLLLLSRILFGGMCAGQGNGRGRRWRRRLHERWERMTPEDRERFRAALRERCGHERHEPDAPAV